MGYSRDSYYRFKKIYDQGGEAALQDISCKKPIEKRVEPDIEQAVANMAYEDPAFGQHPSKRVNFQIQCGPALGAFNTWVKGTHYQDWRNRYVADIAQLLIAETLDYVESFYGHVDTESIDLSLPVHT